LKRSKRGPALGDVGLVGWIEQNRAWIEREVIERWGFRISGRRDVKYRSCRELLMRSRQSMLTEPNIHGSRQRLGFPALSAKVDVARYILSSAQTMVSGLLPSKFLLATRWAHSM
jgi:hypothetical protein